MDISPVKGDINGSIELGKHDSSIILRNAPGKKNQLEPLESAKIGNNKVPTKRDSAVTGSIDFGTSFKPKSTKGSLANPDIFNDIDLNKDLGDTDSTLEFILLSLSKCLDIKPKQAVGLLSNNHKYLIHIVVKGTKGGEFTKVQQWYSDLYANSKHLVKLIDSEKVQNSTSLTLQIVKVGLFSSNVELAQSCCRVLSRIGQEINILGS